MRLQWDKWLRYRWMEMIPNTVFQQWAVDMYVKVESMHLDWYSKPEHQDLIRADLYQVRSIKSYISHSYQIVIY